MQRERSSAIAQNNEVRRGAHEYMRNPLTGREGGLKNEAGSVCECPPKVGATKVAVGLRHPRLWNLSAESVPSEKSPAQSGVPE